jgi:hypothetical protein
MTYEEATKVLDQVRAGQGSGFGEAEILLALWYTGDFGLHEAVRSQGVDSPVQGEDWGARCRARAIMVGASKR